MDLPHPYDPSWAFASRAIHGPQHYRSEPHEPSVEAIYVNATFRYPEAAEVERWFQEPKEHFLYSRYGNPTVRDFEERMTSLEGGADAVAFSSGTAAFLGSLLSVAHAGQHVLLQRYCYGGSYYLAQKLGVELGLGCTLVDPMDHASLEQALRPETTALLVETPANPMAAIVDLRQAADWAHAHNLLLVVDSTIASPALQNPLAYGADIVWHSCTKYIGGHGDTMGGVAVCADAGLARSMWGKWMYTLGTNLSPFNAFLLVRGLKTLQLRMDRHSANALALAKWLEADRRVAHVSYPGLESHAGHVIAKEQMNGYGGLLAVDVVGGREAAFRLHDRLQLISRGTSLGDVHSLVSHPASTSHRQYTPEERASWCVTEGTLRISVGIEEIGDLIADVDRALG